MDAIQRSLSEMNKAFNKRFDSIQGQLQPEESLTGVAAELAAFEALVVTSFQAVHTQIGMLTQQVDTLEMRSRRKILLLHGVPEEEKEDTPKLIMKTMSEQLKLASFSCDDISRCQRMGRASGSKPRPILFKIRDVALRDKIWRSKTNLKGSGFTLSEFLTKYRHDMFLEARQKFGVTKCWTQEGNVFVLGPDGARHRISSSEDLAALLKKVGAAAKPQAAVSRAAATDTKDSVSTRPRREKLGSKK